MNSVTVNKAELIKILHKNKKEHRAIFESAQKAYRAMVIKELDAELARAREGKTINVKRFTHWVTPVDHTGDYETAIRMLEMSVDRKVTIDRQQFESYVNDDWEWARSWALANSHYTSSSKFDKYVS